MRSRNRFKAIRTRSHGALKSLLLLFVVFTVVLFIGSYWRFAWIPNPGGLAAGLGDGRIWWLPNMDVGPLPEYGLYAGTCIHRREAAWIVTFNPVRALQIGYSDPAYQVLPLWPFIVFPLVLLVVHWWRNRSLRPPSACRWCQYDLIGSPLAVGGTVTCPECGHLTARQSPSPPPPTPPSPPPPSAPPRSTA
jgi:hypothetical protein